ncbi:MAG: TolC family protein [Planctomycetales bacterium]|nr:TolC family protein [Planctomycetales bacterium]
MQLRQAESGAPATISVLLVAVLVFASQGCSRSYYRRQADQEAYQIVDQHASDPRWPLDEFSIQVDPASRMFDPFSADCPPMPPDDPTSHQLMHCVDCRKGWPHWHDNGNIDDIENPYWQSSLGLNEDGILALDADQAVRLALVHSSNFQSQLEELYLSALDVSFERFRFDHQFFGGYSTFFTADGRNRNGDGESSSVLALSTFPASRGIRMNKLYTTGAELVVGFANSLVWQFAGPNTYDSTTLLDFTLVQPLLRGAGRARVMERLTIAERTLLANVRQMERFRRGFYLEIVTGRDAGNGPSRRGGFFGGSGLDGFTGVGGGGFGRVGSGGAGGFGGGAGAPEAGGFVGLLQAKQTLRNQEANIASLRNSVVQLEAYFEAGRIDYFQVELARQALLNAQSRWLNAQAAYQADLDDFKRDLGLPPQIEMELQDDMLSQFNLIDTAILPIQNSLTSLQEDLGDEVLKLMSLINASNGSDDSTLLIDRQLDAVVARIDQVVHLTELILAENVDRAAVDIENLASAVPRRVADIQSLRQKLKDQTESLIIRASGETTEQSEIADITDNAVDLEELQQLPTNLDANLTTLTVRFKTHLQQLQNIQNQVDDVLRQRNSLDQQQFADGIRRAIVLPFPNELRAISDNLLELSLLQARARSESITLPPIELDWRTAYEIARRNRRDWMNARASLVDSWRLIEFNANDLKSQLDIVFSGDIGNKRDNPFSLDSSTGRLRVGLEFDAPITRLSERNTYRQALIEYQQARRTYYRYRDSIAQLLRNSIRTVELNQLNFELLRSAVLVSIKQVELARLRLQEPPKPEEESSFGATTARDLVSALSDLLNAQNDFLSVWVNYEVLRRGLDFDLGTMELDPEGLWVDPGPIGAVEMLSAGDIPEELDGYVPPAEFLDSAPNMQPLNAAPDQLELEPPVPGPQVLPGAGEIHQGRLHWDDAAVQQINYVVPNIGHRVAPVQRLPVMAYDE